MVKDEKSRISGKDAAYVALDAAKYPPVHISEVDSSANGSDGTAVMEKLPSPVSDQPGDGERRQAPPRVRKPSPIHDQYLALRRTWQATALAFAKPSATPCPTSSSTSCSARSSRR